MHPLVVHCKKQYYDVYIGRPSKWSNPFHIGVDGDRQEVLEMYRNWLHCQPELMAALPELKGKVLGCWCCPKSCHGEILAELANPVSLVGRTSIVNDDTGNSAVVEATAETETQKDKENDDAGELHGWSGNAGL